MTTNTLPGERELELAQRISLPELRRLVEEARKAAQQEHRYKSYTDDLLDRLSTSLEAVAAENERLTARVEKLREILSRLDLSDRAMVAVSRQILGVGRAPKSDQPAVDLEELLRGIGGPQSEAWPDALTHPAPTPGEEQ